MYCLLFHLVRIKDHLSTFYLFKKMEAIFGRASIVGRGWGLMMRSPGILATATVAAAPAEAASDKGGGDQQWNHSNARMRLRPNCHCSSTMRLRECSKELPRLFHWPSQQRMLASATPVRNEQNGGSGAGYSKRYSKQVQHKYNDGDDGGNDTGRQKYFKQHRDAEYHKDRPNRGRRAMRRGQEQGNVYKTGRHGETLVLHEGQWVGSDYFNERYGKFGCCVRGVNTFVSLCLGNVSKRTYLRR